MRKILRLMICLVVGGVVAVSGLSSGEVRAAERSGSHVGKKMESKKKGKSKSAGKYKRKSKHKKK